MKELRKKKLQQESKEKYEKLKKVLDEVMRIRNTKNPDDDDDYPIDDSIFDITQTLSTLQLTMNFKTSSSQSATIEELKNFLPFTDEKNFEFEKLPIYQFSQPELDIVLACIKRNTDEIESTRTAIINRVVSLCSSKVETADLHIDLYDQVKIKWLDNPYSYTGTVLDYVLCRSPNDEKKNRRTTIIFSNDKRAFQTTTLYWDSY
jgi:hypothetical protein